MIGIVASVAALLTPPGDVVELQNLPSCGVMAVYTVARQYRKDVTLSDVETVLGNRASAHSLEQLREAIRGLGLFGRSVRVAPETLDQLRCPSIMYISPDRLGKEFRIGHFVVIQSIRGDFVRLIDLTHSPEPIDVPRTVLFASWTGECLEISEHRFLMPRASTWKALSAGVAACGLSLLWWGARRARAVKCLVSLCAAFGAAGCQEAPPVLRHITFIEPTVSAGTVPRGPDAEVECRFVVGPERVVITSIDSACSCIAPAQDLVGKELAPGTRHSFRVTLDTYGRFGDSSGIVTCLTQPPSVEPVECRVTAYVDAPPRPIGTTPFRIEAVVGSSPVLEVEFEHFRSDGYPPVEWDMQHSDLAGCVVQNAECTRDRYQPANCSMVGTGYRDLFKWQLQLPGDLTIGRHRIELLLAWSDASYEPQRVPLDVEIYHPLRTSLDRVFFGIVGTGTAKLVEIAVLDSDEEKMREAVLETEGDFITASLDRDNGLIRVELSNLAPVGRVDGNVRVCTSQGIPDLVIPVSAVVYDGQSVSNATGAQQ